LLCRLSCHSSWTIKSSPQFRIHYADTSHNRAHSNNFLKDKNEISTSDRIPFDTIGLRDHINWSGICGSRYVCGLTTSWSVSKRKRATINRGACRSFIDLRWHEKGTKVDFNSREPRSIYSWKLSKSYGTVFMYLVPFTSYGSIHRVPYF
jgi:hypothetical protein